MPTVQENIENWGKEYGWSHRGDEWSVAWGAPAMQWHGTRRARIDCFTTLVPKAIRNDDESQVFVNVQFMREAENLKRLSRLHRRG